MTKAQYLTALHSCLAGQIAESELRDVLDYYDEYFEEAGITQEAWTAQALGEPAALAAQILAEQGGAAAPAKAARPARPKRSRRWIGWAALAALALLAVLVGGGLLWHYRAPSEPVEIPDGAAEVPGGLPEGMSLTYANGYRLAIQGWPIQRLDIDVSWADITIRQGAGWSLSMIWNRWKDALGYGYQGGTLYIRSRQEANPDSVLDLRAPVIDITVPALEIDNFTISTGLGNLTLQQVAAGSVTLSAGNGDIILSRCELNEAGLSLALGNLTAEECTAQLFNAQLVQGDALLRACVLTDATLTVTMGDVELRQCPPLNDFRQLTLTAPMGSIHLNDRERDQSYQFEGHGQQLLAATCTLGDIAIQVGSD